MTERRTLLESIARTTADYRLGEITEPTPEHIDRWVSQFDEDVHVPILGELDHVLKRTYFSQRKVKKFLTDLINNEELAGQNPAVFWKKAHFLDIQQNGHSQHEMLEVFDESLRGSLGMGIADCGADGGAYIYIDDGLFSGSRIGNDLESWIQNEAPPDGAVHVIVIALHTGGYWMLKRRLEKAIEAAGKRLRVKYWRLIEIENRKTYRRDSEVLWPAVLPEDSLVQAYLQEPQRFPFEARPEGGNTQLFSSEQGRQLLETQFLLAGVKIRDFCAAPKPIMRPLGFSPFGLGFGSTIVTHRNCPNNSPLALWWGDPDAGPNHPFSRWYPLFPRKTYSVGAIDYELVL